MAKRREIEGIKICELEKHGITLDYLVCEEIPSEDDGFPYEVEMIASHALGLHDECIIVTGIDDYKGRFTEGGGTKILKGLANACVGNPVYVLNAIDSALCTDKGFDTILKNAGYEYDKEMTEEIDEDGIRVYSKLVEEGEEDE